MKLNFLCCPINIQAEQQQVFPKYQKHPYKPMANGYLQSLTTIIVNQRNFKQFKQLVKLNADQLTFNIMSSAHILCGNIIIIIAKQ